MSARWLLSLPLVGLALGSLGQADEPKKADPPARTLGTLERLDPRFDKLIPKGAALEVLVEGHDWVEGPVWVKNGNFLLFSDIPRNSIYKWEEGKGESLFL